MFASLSNSKEMLRALIPENKKIAFALNGGKDSYVCADLVLKENIKVDVWFFWDQEEMDEVKFELDRFLEQTNIDLFVLPSNSSLFANMKNVLTWLKKEFGIEICIDGTRQTDNLFQNTSNSKVQQTSGDWPPMLRVMPVYDWSYKQIWDYIETNRLSIPSLYTKKGYTSLGKVGTTFPNFKLWDRQTKTYKHAKFLTDVCQTDSQISKDENISEFERIGRLQKGYCLPVCILGEVVRGKGEGKKLGFPTANLSLTHKCFSNSEAISALQDGIYGGFAKFVQSDTSTDSSKEKEEYLVVCSVGANITYGQTEKTIEVHLIDQTLPDFYGEALQVTFDFYLRPMLKFEGIENLKEMIQEDIDRYVFNVTKNKQ